MPAPDSASNQVASTPSLAQALDQCAKRWWSASLLAKVAGFLVGSSITVLPPEPVPFLIAGCTILAELCMFRSDAIKSTSQRFRRKLDIADGFGWQIPSNELSDVLVRCSWWVQKRARTHPVANAYFASTEPPGAIRALQNVSESAWWTKHNAERMGTICWAIVCIGVIISFVSLIVTLQGTGDHTAQVNAARIVTAFLMLFLSLGIVKLAIGYSSLSKNSASSEAAAERMLHAKDAINELDAFKVMYEYHLGRAVGPIIPTWLWKLRQEHLDRTWKELRGYRGRTPPATAATGDGHLRRRIRVNSPPCSETKGCKTSVAR